MFDIGVSELAVIGVVALIVIGPEELPRVARTAGHLLGRLRRYVADVKSDISREMEVADLKRMQEQVQESVQDFHQTVKEQMEATATDIRHGVDAGTATSAASELSALAPIATPLAPVQQHIEESSLVREHDENQMDLFGDKPVAQPPSEPLRPDRS